MYKMKDQGIDSMFLLFMNQHETPNATQKSFSRLRNIMAIANLAVV